MVRMTKERYAEHKGKKMQYVSAELNGQILVYDPDRHIKINAVCEEDEFTLMPVFVDSTRNALSDAHASVRPRVTLISGPAIQTGEYTFRYDPDYFRRDPQRLWTGVTICVEADGDSRYKSAVQELNIQMVR